MTQNINDAKKKFEEKLIEGLSAQGNILAEGYSVDINNFIKDDKFLDILYNMLLLNNNNSKIISEVIDTFELSNINFNIFKFIQLSDFNLIEKNNLYKKKNISNYDIKKFKNILNALKIYKPFNKSLKRSLILMNNLIMKPSEPSDKISKINKQKKILIEDIKKYIEGYKTYLTDKNFDVENLDFENFINYLADEYINEIIEINNVGTFKSDVNKLTDEIDKENPNENNISDIINKIISDTNNKTTIAKLYNNLNTEDDIAKNYPNMLKDDYLICKNIENILSNNKSIFSRDLKDNSKINNFYNNNEEKDKNDKEKDKMAYESIYFDKNNSNNTKSFIIFFKKLYRVYNDSVSEQYKTKYMIIYILYRFYYYYLNIVENIEKFNKKYISEILINYKKYKFQINIDKWTYNNDRHGSQQNAPKIIDVLKDVLTEYNKFFKNLTDNIINLLSYDKDNSFAVTYPNDKKTNKTQFFFTEFKKHIIATISSAESEFNKDVSLYTLSEDVILNKLSEHVYKYYNITFKYELYDSIYIYKDESLDYLYKLYKYKYDEYCKKYQDDYLRFISSSELEELFIKHKNKDNFKAEFIEIITTHSNKILSELMQTNLQNVFNELNELNTIQDEIRIQQDLLQKQSDGLNELEDLHYALRKKKLNKIKKSSTRVAHSDMLGDIVEENLKEVFDTFKSDNSRTGINLDREKESLLHIVEENLKEVFDTFKSDKTIQDKVDSSLLDIVEENLIDIFDTFNTRTTSREDQVYIPLKLDEVSLSSSSEESSPVSTPRNHTKQESTINPQKYEKIINNLEKDKKMYIFAVDDNLADDIVVRYKVGYSMDEAAKAANMNKNISLRSFNNYIFYIDNNNNLKEKFKINRKYNLKYILKIIYETYDDIIIVSKRDNIKNILYQYKDSNYINIIFIYEKNIEIRNIENFEKIIDNKNQDKDNSTIQNDNNDYKIIREHFHLKHQIKFLSYIFKMLKLSNKKLIISDVTVTKKNIKKGISSDINVTQDIINGIYELDKNDRNTTGLRYNHISTKHGDNIILSPNLVRDQGKYTILLTLNGTYGVTGHLDIDINDFYKLLNGKVIKMTKLSDFLNYETKNYDDKINITISIEDNPSTKTDDSLLDIVEGNLRNVFDSLN